MNNLPSSAVSAGTSRSVSQFPSFCKILLKKFSNPIVVVGENSYGKIGRFRYRQADIRACSANARDTTLQNIHELKIDENNLKKIACDPSKTNNFARSLFAKVVANAPEFAPPEGVQQLPAQKKNIESCVQIFYGFALSHPRNDFSAFSVISILAGIPESKRTPELMKDLRFVISENGQYIPEVVKLLENIDSGQRVGFIQKASQLSKRVGKQRHIAKALNDIPAQRLTQELLDQSDKLSQQTNNGEDIIDILTLVGQRPSEQVSDFVDQCEQLLSNLKIRDGLASIIVIASWSNIEPGDIERWICQAQKLYQEDEQDLTKALIFQALSEVPIQYRSETFISQCRELGAALQVGQHMPDVIQSLARMKFKPGAAEFAQLKTDCIALCKDIHDIKFKLSAMKVYMAKQFIVDDQKKSSDAHGLS